MRPLTAFYLNLAAMEKGARRYSLS